MKMKSRIRAVIQLFARKSRTFQRMYLNISGAPEWSSNDVKAFVKEGYFGNPYVYAALNKISTAMGEAPPILFRIKGGSKMERDYDEAYGMDTALKMRSAKKWSRSQCAEQHIGSLTARYMNVSGCSKAIGRRLAIKALVASDELEQLSSHPILDLLHRPNGFYQTTYTEFVHAWSLSMLIAGECFTEPVGDGEPTELYILPVKSVRSMKGSKENPLPGFIFGTNTNFVYSPDPKETEIFFSKFYDPLHPTRGLAPMNAAIRSVDLNNAARKYNFEYMHNSGIPPAIITGEFKDEQRQAFQDDLDENMNGPENAGRVLAMAGKNMQYHQLSMDAAKLQWGDVLTMSAKEVAIVWNVAPELIGDNANKTYNNFAEARLSLYQDNIIPFMMMMYQHWNQSWVKRFDEDVILDFDADQILAIADDLAKVYERLDKIIWLTWNEKRTATNWPGLGPEGDIFLVPLNLVPLSTIMSDDSIDEKKAEAARKLLREYGGDGAVGEPYFVDE